MAILTLTHREQSLDQTAPVCHEQGGFAPREGRSVTQLDFQVT
jgi:hypothetical protein